MARYAEVEVLTTCAKDYITWKNEYRPGKEKINSILVHRFPVQKERDPNRFGMLQQQLFQFAHEKKEELEWLDEEGPNAPELIDHIKNNEAHYDFFIFFSYRYYHTF